MAMRSVNGVTLENPMTSPITLKYVEAVKESGTFTSLRTFATSASFTFFFV